METELNRFVYVYNYTPSVVPDAVPDHKSPAEVFFGRKFKTLLDIFTPIAKPVVNTDFSTEKDVTTV